MNPLIVIAIVLFALIGWCIYRFVQRVKSGKSIKRSLLGWLTYVVIATVLVVGSLTVVVLTEVSAEALMAWVTPVATAALVIGSAAKGFWGHNHHSTFWITLVLLVVAHFALFLFVLSPDLRWNPLMVAIVGIPEIAAATMILGLVLRSKPGEAASSR